MVRIIDRYYLARAFTTIACCIYIINQKKPLSNFSTVDCVISVAAIALTGYQCYATYSKWSLCPRQVTEAPATSGINETDQVANEQLKKPI